MRLTVFGATGGIGGNIVRQALDAGHTVTAVVRDPARLAHTHPALRVVTAPDLHDLAVVRGAIEGGDAVLSGIGPRGRKDGPVASTATRGILRAMEASGVRRFLAVSAAPVGAVSADDGFLNRRILMPLIGVLLREVYDDLRAMETDLERSNLDWTTVRPPKLTDKPLSGDYRSVIGATVPRGYSISRADVAHAMLAAVDDPATFRMPVGVAN